MPPPKPSGAQGRKRRQKQKSEDEKGAKFMAMFLQKESPSDNQNQQHASTETAPKDSEGQATLSLQEHGTSSGHVQQASSSMLSTLEPEIRGSEFTSEIEQSEPENTEALSCPHTESTVEARDSVEELTSEIEQSEPENTDALSCPQTESSGEVRDPVEATELPQSSQNETDLRSTDISLWPKSMNSRMRDHIVLQGPQPLPALNFVYPRDRDKRHFSSFYGYVVLPNKEQVLRRWLQYSVSADRIYCFCCKLFDPNPKSKFGTEGMNNWHHLTEYISSHELSSAHIKARRFWIDAENSLKKNTGIDKDLQGQISQERNRWREVLERIIAVTVYLATNNLAFRGSSNKLYTPNNGHFLGLIQLLGKFEPVMRDHLKRVTSKEVHAHYCGNIIQNEIINLMASQVKNCILERAKKAKYFSVMLDCTQDASRTEQLSYTVRFVDIDGEHVAIKEHFIGYRPVSDTSGQGLANILLDEMTKCSLDMNNCRGQGYDNGANMVGLNKGVQSRILQQYPRAFFNPCGCHSLNLVTGDASKSSVKSVNLFGVLQRLYTLFASSSKRWCIISDHVKHLTLKKVCATRWECRVESLKAVRYQYVEIHKALLDLEQNLDDPTLASEARSLSAMMEDFSFIVTLIIWYDLLFQVHIVSKSMQSRDMEITRCNNLLKNCTEFVKKFRDSGYESAKIAAKEIALALDIEAQFTMRKRPRKKKRLFTYESQDEPITDAEELFKISVFYPLVDNMTASLERRFSQLSNHNELWGFLYNIMCLPENDKLQNMCKTLEAILTQPAVVDLEGKQSDIDGKELFEELKHIQPMISHSSITPLEVLKLINDTQSHDLFRNIWIAMRILLTIPITVASSERSFSKLKLIKTYLRTTMTDERLSSLAILSIESDLVEKLDYSAAIDAFAAAKSRKVDFS